MTPLRPSPELVAIALAVTMVTTVALPGPGDAKYVVLDQVFDTQTATDMLDAALGVPEVQELLGNDRAIILAQVFGSAERYRFEVAGGAIESSRAVTIEGDSDYQIRMHHDTALTLVNSPDQANTAACLIKGGEIVVSASSFLKQAGLKVALSGLLSDVIPCAPFEGVGSSFTWNGGTGTVAGFTGGADRLPGWPTDPYDGMRTTFVCTLTISDRPELADLIPPRVFVDTVALLGDSYLTPDIKSDIFETLLPESERTDPDTGTPRTADAIDAITYIEHIEQYVDEHGRIPDFLPVPLEIEPDTDVSVVINEHGAPIGIRPDTFVDLHPTRAVAEAAGVDFQAPPAVTAQDPDLLQATANQNADIATIQATLATNPTLDGGGAAVVRSNNSSAEGTGGTTGATGGATGGTASGAAPAPAVVGGSSNKTAAAAATGVSFDDVDTGRLDPSTLPGRGLAFLLGIAAAQHSGTTLAENGLLTPDDADTDSLWEVEA